jgi:hypothetical protein
VLNRFHISDIVDKNIVSYRIEFILAIHNPTDLHGKKKSRPAHACMHARANVLHSTVKVTKGKRV